MFGSSEGLPTLLSRMALFMETNLRPPRARLASAMRSRVIDSTEHVN